MRHSLGFNVYLLGNPLIALNDFLICISTGVVHSCVLGTGSRLANTWSILGLAKCDSWVRSGLCLSPFEISASQSRLVLAVSHGAMPNHFTVSGSVI